MESTPLRVALQSSVAATPTNRGHSFIGSRGRAPSTPLGRPVESLGFRCASSKMAASETVRLRLQFDYPPPGAPHCTSFWLLIDLNGCRVVTDLISLIRQRFGFSSGALLGLYLEGALLPPAESARLVRDNDCLRCAGGSARRGRARACARRGAAGSGGRGAEGPAGGGLRAALL